MNTYDPMDRIVYRHMDQQPASSYVPLAGTPSIKVRSRMSSADGASTG